MASDVVDRNGSINLLGISWPDIRRMDELGDLSRGYRRLLERLEAYHHYLRALSGKLSHELRTPIAVVKSSLENLSQVDASAVRAQYVMRAQEGISRLSYILNAMRAASWIEESVNDAELEPTDLNDFLSAIIAAYKETYTQHTIRFQPLPLPVKVDIAQELFVHMTDKLMDNALDFSPPSKPIIIRLEQSLDGVALHMKIPVPYCRHRWSHSSLTP